MHDAFRLRDVNQDDVDDDCDDYQSDDEERFDDDAADGYDDDAESINICLRR